MNPELFPKLRTPEEFDQSREQFADSAAFEHKEINAIIMTFLDNNLLKGVENLETRLTVEEIQRDDAEHINRLKEKVQSARLLPEEKEELKFREDGDLFFSEDEHKDVQNQFNRFISKKPLVHAGSIVKEAYYPDDYIDGVIRGKKVSFRRITYPKFSDEELEHESESPHPFYYDSAIWKDRSQFEYSANIDGKPISPKVAEKLFKKYERFAKQRRDEIVRLKEAKEKKILGHVIERESLPLKIK